MAKLKHRFFFLNENDGKTVLLGDVYSFDDSSKYSLGDLRVDRLVNIVDYPQLTLQLDEFYLGIKPEKAESKELVKFHKFLYQNPAKGAFVLYKPKDPDSGMILSAINSRYGFTIGFLCKVLKSAPISLPPAPSLPVISPPSEKGIVKDEHATVTAAEGHYNQLKRDLETRHKSTIFHMRLLNNFVKAELIETSSLNCVSASPSESIAVLDLACGKGGDIQKWLKIPRGIARYVGVDIAKNSLTEFAEERLPNIAQRSHDPMFLGSKIEKLVCADLGKDSLTTSTLEVYTWGNSHNGNNNNNKNKGEWTRAVPLESTSGFDIVSCQFAIHYMFRSEKSAKHFLTEVSTQLKDRGYLIATTIDCRVLAEYLLESLHGPLVTTTDVEKPPTGEIEASRPVIRSKLVNWERGHHHSNNNNNKSDDSRLELQLVNDLDQLLLTITMTRDQVFRLLQKYDEPTTEGTGDLEDCYGVQYLFQLQDNAEESAVNAPEWLVPQGDVLQRLANDSGLIFKRAVNFHDFVHERFQSDTGLDRAKHMKIFNIFGTISDAEWALIRLYTVLEFQKVDPKSITQFQQSQKTSTVQRNVRFQEKSRSSQVEESDLSRNKQNNSLRLDEWFSTQFDHCPPSPTGPPPESAFRSFPALSPSLMTTQKRSFQSWLESAHCLVPNRPINKKARKVLSIPIDTPPEEYAMDYDDTGNAADSDDDDDSDDEDMRQFLESRAEAIRMAGGEDQYNALSEDEVNRLLQIAKEKLGYT